MMRHAKSWEEFKTDLAQLAQTIKQSSFQPTLIVALSRGGFIPGRLLSNDLSVKRLTSIGIDYPTPDRSIPRIFSMPSPLEYSERVLLVEDCLESGRSLAAAKDAIQSKITEVRTCSVYALTRTEFAADFMGFILDEPPYFPWE